MPGFDYSIHAVIPAAAQKAAEAAKTATGESFSFGDFLDVVNPLQHIPVVSAIYRQLTGDQIGTGEKIAGDALYGGLWGFVSSLADAAFKEVTGNYFGDTVLAMVTGDGSETRIAQADRANVADGPPQTLGLSARQASEAYRKTSAEIGNINIIN
jgi:hypothetical protein